MTANKSHLLINEPALQVLPSLAKAIGLEEAIILQQLHYWLNNSKVDGREYDGRKWIYNSYQEWQGNFPFWSVQQIQRIFLNLERGGLVISEKLDARKHDQTKFYTLDYDALCAMEYINFDSSDVSKSNDVKKELTESNKTKTTTKNKADKPPTPPEIALYREVVSKYPNKAAYQQVIDAIQKVSARLGRDATADDLRPYFQTWCTKSGNLYNFSVWLLEWAVTGTTQNARATQAKQPAAFDAINQWLQSKGE